MTRRASASDGDNAGGGQAAAGGPQTAGDSTWTAQVGSPGVFAPVSLLTDLDPGEGPGGGEDPAGDVEEAVGDLVGSLVGLLPLAGASGDGDRRRAEGAPGALGGGPGDPRGFRRVVDNGSSTVTQPAVDLVTGATAADGEVQTLGVQAGSLPLTGFGVLVLFALGLWLLASGLALRLVPGGKRR